MNGARLELSSEERFTEQDLDDSCSKRVEHEINSTEFNAVNPWATLDHPHTTRQGGASLDEYDNTREIGEAHREGIVNLDFRGSRETNHAPGENSIKHKHAKSINNL